MKTGRKQVKILLAPNLDNKVKPTSYRSSITRIKSF